MNEPNLTPEEAEGVPEYEVGQYLPQMGVYDESHRDLLREKHGYIRTYFKARADNFRTIQRWLNQARMSTSYDAYLARATTWAIWLMLAGILLGIGVATWLANAGYLAGLSSPVAVDGPIVELIAANKVTIAMGLITILGALSIGAITFSAFYYYPWFRMDARRRNIDVMLPHGIVFMYALSSGGMNLLEVCRELADSEDAYTEVANEFDMVVRDVELFGNDLITALRNARNTTPSHRLEQFLDDMISVIDVGGDASSFFEQQSKRYLTEARDAQSDFLETLALLAEVFIVLFVAAPLFAIVTLILVSLLGGETVLLLQLFIYALLPLAMAAFVILVAVLSDPYVMPPITLRLDREEAATPAAELGNDERLESYRSRMRFRWLDDLRVTPIRTLREEPLLTLMATVPVALVAIGVAVATGQVSLSWQALVAAPYHATVWLAVVPLLIVGVPLSVFHELRRGHEALVTRRVPVLLDILSSANNMGIAITDALGMVSRWVAGPFADEIVLLRNDIEWNNDLSGALLAFGNRMRTPQLSRTLKLLAEGARATADLGPLLAVAAEDTRNRYRMAKQREGAMGGYIAVVVIAFLVYLLVVALLESSYLTPIATVAGETSGNTAPGMSGLPVSLAELPVEQYRLLFFHSALIQGVGTGLLAGKLSDNRLLTGLKYSIAFVLLTIVVFSYL